jgi:predicted pyridoxine 5'-phosphate oxidase superfamily flavin-nucleotide-binding protein
MIAQIPEWPIFRDKTALRRRPIPELPMSDTSSSDVAFTPAVKAIQARKGSRDAYADVEQRGGWRTEIDADLAARLAEASSLYFATASADGQPYIQHRGGPKGFVKILDKNTLAFADYSGNRQYITQGNLSENPRAYIFVMDYAHRRRVKIWGEARVVDDDPALLKLPAVHPAEIRRRRCGGGAGLARCADCEARGGSGGAEGRRDDDIASRPQAASRCFSQTKSG